MPSAEDLNITLRISRTFSGLGIKLHDHISSAQIHITVCGKKKNYKITVSDTVQLQKADTFDTLVKTFLTAQNINLNTQK